MNRPELIDPRRFGVWIVAGLGGIINMLVDYFDQGGELNEGDVDTLKRHRELLDSVILTAEGKNG